MHQSAVFILSLKPKMNDSREWLLECEARFRIKQCRIHGVKWWNKEKEGIKKMRGEAGLNTLIENMEKLRRET